MLHTCTRTVRTLLVVFAALGSFLGAASCDKKSNASSGPPSSEAPAAAPGEVRVVASEHGFAPASISLPKGGPGSKATITFVRTTDKTCATEVVFPDLNVKKELPLNQPVAIEVPTDSARTLTFQCGMGMYKGSLLVK